MTNRTIRWALRLDEVELVVIEPEIAAFLRANAVDDHAAYVARLVIEEIVRNLIIHTPPYASDEKIFVGIELDPATLRVLIEDHRPPFDPFDAPPFDPSAALDARRAGGMGLHLVRSMTDELRYEQDGRLNRLTAFVRRA